MKPSKQNTLLFVQSFVCTATCLYMNDVGIYFIRDYSLTATTTESLTSIIFNWIFRILAVVPSFVLLIAFFWLVGVEAFDEFILKRIETKLLIFYFWQACVVTYFAIRFVSTFSTGRNLDIFGFIYYAVLMLLSVFGLVASLTYSCIVSDDLKRQDVAYGQIKNCPVVVDEEEQTFSITCKQGLVVFPVACLVPIKIKDDLLDNCSFYIYVQNAETPFIQHIKLVFESKREARLAKETIGWHI
jgi:hypothetical protein